MDTNNENQNTEELGLSRQTNYKSNTCTNSVYDDHRHWGFNVYDDEPQIIVLRKGYNRVETIVIIVLIKNPQNITNLELDNQIGFIIVRIVFLYKTSKRLSRRFQYFSCAMILRFTGMLVKRDPECRDAGYRLHLCHFVVNTLVRRLPDIHPTIMLPKSHISSYFIQVNIIR